MWRSGGHVPCRVMYLCTLCTCWGAPARSMVEGRTVEPGDSWHPWHGLRPIMCLQAPPMCRAFLVGLVTRAGMSSASTWEFKCPAGKRNEWSFHCGTNCSRGSAPLLAVYEFLRNQDKACARLRA